MNIFKGNIFKNSAILQLHVIMGNATLFFAPVMTNGFSHLELAFVLDTASLGASSVPKGTWHLPVRPGDSLSLEAEILEARRSASRPDRGIVRCGYVLNNQEGAKVFAMEAIHFVRCREGAADE